ncbi:holin [Paenibacillus sp. JX-17]|uniref:Holin n=1 Tax=Paenibacillus lacisoli TaxID=3064525 RepID=A0ABT9CD43_9BACL|nr:holin [Paenibacillus sp. JX-17]MDO7907176.1 holin [Paenibacillus sp. JX-17]
MANELLTTVLSFASVLAVFVMSLVQLVKTTINVPKQWIPAIGLAIGLFVGWTSFPFTDLELVPRLWSGGLAGLAATGLFELAFNKRSGMSQDDHVQKPPGA